ncbi:MAG: hypothetical protein KKD75_05490 [Nanoarchaeota archaeon]|nr:hypothetical protein [Nanoarchaeota archaeon]MBU1632438.1 hypothetical protein [Nanoarchaeota archaeon]
MPPLMFNPTILYAEVIFSVILVTLCLIIYYKTKETFELTQHRGVGYFRKTFLFFAFAYAFRLITRIIFITGLNFDWFIHPRNFMGVFTLVFVGYFSTMAIFYLFLSSTWKKLKWKNTIYFHLIAFLIAFISFFMREPFILISCQATLLAIVGVISYKLSKKPEKFSKLFVVYVLLILFWIFGLIPLTSRWIFPREMNFIVQIISLVIFAIIFYKVIRWTK